MADKVNNKEEKGLQEIPKSASITYNRKTFAENTGLSHIKVIDEIVEVQFPLKMAGCEGMYSTYKFPKSEFKALMETLYLT